MNVLYLAPEFFPVWGGSGTYIHELIKHLPKDTNIHILTPARTYFGKVKLMPIDYSTVFTDNIHVHQIGKAEDTFLYNLNFQINCMKVINKLTKKFDIDIIHSTSALPDLFVNPKKIKIPIITTIHTTIQSQRNTIKNSGIPFWELERSEQFTLALGKMLILFENNYYNSIRHYITVSAWAKNEILKTKKIAPSRINVIHNGIDCEKFNPILREVVNNYYPSLSKIKEPKLLFLSRMIESKGLSYYTKAIPKILKKVDIHFIFAGPGLDPTKKIPSNYCSYLGYIPHEKTRFLYCASDIFILPSLSENFPFGILEAMASELAVIASNVGGIPEIIKHNQTGILIPSKDSEEIADNVINLVEDNSLKNYLGINARNHVKINFDWKVTAERTKDLYMEVKRK